MLIQHFVALCHSSANFPPTSAFKSSYCWSILSGLPMIASNARQLTGRPKLLYLQTTAFPWIIQEVPNTGLETGEWGRGFGLLLAGQARKHSWKIQDRYICIEWSVKQRERAAGYSETRWCMEKGWMLQPHLLKYRKDNLFVLIIWWVRECIINITYFQQVRMTAFIEKWAVVATGY